VSASQKNPADFPAQILERRFQGAAPWIEYNRPVWRNAAQLTAHSFSHPAFQSIAFDRLSQAARNRKAESCRHRWAVSTQTKCGKKATADANTGFIDLAEFRGPENPSWLRK
jgi:hypothetical protein